MLTTAITVLGYAAAITTGVNGILHLFGLDKTGFGKVSTAIGVDLIGIYKAFSGGQS